MSSGGVLQLELSIFRDAAVDAATRDAQAARRRFDVARTKALSLTGVELSVRLEAFYRCRRLFDRLVNAFFQTHYWKPRRSYGLMEGIWLKHGPETLRLSLYQEMFPEFR